MNLKSIFLIGAGGIAIFAAAAALAPQLLTGLLDPVSAEVNASNARISLYAFALWAVAMLIWLSRTRPATSDWPAPRPVWLGLAWLVLCVSYTGFEHVWFAFAAYISEEDGLLESATAVVLLVCAALLVSGIRRAGAIDRRLGVGVTALAIVCFLLLMEEISWGQRILGFETPDEIDQINAQQETNLHNMFVGYNQLIRLAIALVIATVLIDRARWVGWLRFPGFDRLMPPAAAIYFVPSLLYAHTYDELFEEVVGLFLLVYVIDLRRRLRDGA